MIRGDNEEEQGSPGKEEPFAKLAQAGHHCQHQADDNGHF